MDFQQRPGHGIDKLCEFIFVARLVLTAYMTHFKFIILPDEHSMSQFGASSQSQVKTTYGSKNLGDKETQEVPVKLG